MQRILSLILLLTAIATQAQVTARLDSATIRIGEQTRLHIDVVAQEGARVTFPSYEPQSELTSGVEVLETTGDTTRVSDHQQQFSRAYLLTAWDSAHITIPAQAVEVNGKKLTTKPLTLAVKGIAIDSTQQARPAQGVQDNPFAWSDWYPVMLLALVLLLLLALLTVLWRRSKSQQPLMKRLRMKKPLQPHEKALAEIAQVKADFDAHPDLTKEHYTRLTEALRVYLEERFHIRAMEMTSEQILDALRAQQDPTMVAELRQLLRTADLVKFAKHDTLQEENRNHLESVVRFVEETKQEQPEAPTEVVPEETPQVRRRWWHTALIVLVALAALVVLVLLGFSIYELII